MSATLYTGPPLSRADYPAKYQPIWRRVAWIGRPMLVMPVPAGELWLCDRHPGERAAGIMVYERGLRLKAPLRRARWLWRRVIRRPFLDGGRRGVCAICARLAEASVSGLTAAVPLR